VRTEDVGSVPLRGCIPALRNRCAVAAVRAAPRLPGAHGQCDRLIVHVRHEGRAVGFISLVSLPEAIR
jgi:hypothetical protein